MRVSVAPKFNQKNRGRTKEDKDENSTINFKTFKKSRHTSHQAGRLCDDMEIFQKNVLSFGNVKKPQAM